MYEMNEALVSLAQVMYEMSKAKKFLEKNPIFEKQRKKAYEAEDEYLKLKLTAADRKVVETLMEEKDLAAEENVFLGYLAGGMDMFMFLKKRGVIPVDVSYLADFDPDEDGGE